MGSRTFYEARSRPQACETESCTFAGVGGGLRGSIGRTATLRADVGFPTRDVDSLGNDAILYAQTVSRW